MRLEILLALASMLELGLCSPILFRKRHTESLYPQGRQLNPIPGGTSGNGYFPDSQKSGNFDIHADCIAKKKAEIRAENPGVTIAEEILHAMAVERCNVPKNHVLYKFVPIKVSNMYDKTSINANYKTNPETQQPKNQGATNKKDTTTPNNQPNTDGTPPDQPRQVPSRAQMIQDLTNGAGYSAMWLLKLDLLVLTTLWKGLFYPIYWYTKMNPA